MSTIIKWKLAATIIVYCHCMLNSSNSREVRPKPTMLPTSPFADHVPIAVPSFFRSKCSFARVNSVGQAGNWQNPKISSPIEGSTILKKLFYWTRYWSISEVTGMMR